MADDLRTEWDESPENKTESDGQDHGSDGQTGGQTGPDGQTGGQTGPDGQTGGQTGPDRQTGRQTGSDALADSGIFRHGYGLIPKYAMQDRELSPTAKAIYAYLCSLCGGGETAFPSVDTIRTVLGLGKDAYYQHRKKLEDAGYITVQRRHRGKTFTSNLYTLNANPKRFQQEPQGEWENRIFAAVRFHGLRGAGYGVLPRAVMTDPRLDAKAKALYAYFASFTGAGTSAFPSLKRILLDMRISAPSYYKYLNQLKDAGYLAAVQRKTGTRFSVNEYYLLDGTEDGKTGRKVRTDRRSETAERGVERGQEIPFAKNPDIMEPYTKNPDTMEPDTMEPDIENPDTTSNRFPTINKKHTRNKFSAIHLSSPPTEQQETGESYETVPREMDGWEEEREPYLYPVPEEIGEIWQNQPEEIRPSKIVHPEDREREKERYLQELKQACGYEDLPIMYPGSDMGLIDNLLSLMASAVCDGTGPTVRIGRQEAGREEARNRFLSLTGEHLRYVVQSVLERGGEVRNLRAYYLTALWNAPDTMELYYQQRVEQDLRAEQRDSWGGGYGWS